MIQFWKEDVQTFHKAYQNNEDKLLAAKFTSFQYWDFGSNKDEMNLENNVQV